MIEDDLPSSDVINPDNLSENPIEIPSLINTKTPEETTIQYLDLFISDKISPYFVVSFREYLLVVTVYLFK